MDLFDGFTIGGEQKVDSNDRLPEGEHKATIVESEINAEYKRAAFNLHFAGMGGKHGTKRWKRHSIKSQKAYDLLVKELDAIGLKPSTTSETRKKIEEAVGLIVTVKVVNQKDSDKYQNFWFVRAEGRDRMASTLKDVKEIFAADEDPFA